MARVRIQQRMDDGGNALSNLNRTARHIALSFGIFGVIAVGLGASFPSAAFIFIYPRSSSPSVRYR
jgi:hypothetical protein